MELLDSLPKPKLTLVYGINSQRQTNIRPDRARGSGPRLVSEAERIELWMGRLLSGD